MYLKHLERHDHGHGHGRGHGHHKKMDRHCGKHEEFGHRFKHPGRHMGKDLFKIKHHHRLNFERGCFSESELADKTTQNVEVGAQDTPERNLLKEFNKMHYWKHGRCCCERNVAPAQTPENAATGEKTDAANTDADAQKDNAPGTSIQNVVEKEKLEFCCCRGRGHFGGHHKGKRGHGFRKPCHKCYTDANATEAEATTEDEGGVKDGFIRKPHRGPFHHHHGHHRGREGYGFLKPNPEGIQGAEGNEEIFMRWFHHGGKWGHGHHGHHHRHWREHGCCVIMVDRAVNTDDSAPGENAIQEVANEEELNVNQTMEQDQTEEVSQEQVGQENDEQVSEVTNNLRKSSLE